MYGCRFSLYSAVNEIGDKGVKVIGKALESNKTLTSLNLSSKERMTVDSHSILQVMRLVLKLPRLRGASFSATSVFTYSQVGL